MHAGNHGTFIHKKKGSPGSPGSPRFMNTATMIPCNHVSETKMAIIQTSAPVQTKLPSKYNFVNFCN